MRDILEISVAAFRPILRSHCCPPRRPSGSVRLGPPSLFPQTKSRISRSAVAATAALAGHDAGGDQGTVMRPAVVATAALAGGDAGGDQGTVLRPTVTATASDSAVALRSEQGMVQRPSAMDLNATRNSDRYLLVGNGGEASLLGRGSYGKVCPAWDRQTERLVAIKIQRRDSETAGRELMFFQCAPKHDNLLRVLDMFVSGSRLSLVFEYCGMAAIRFATSLVLIHSCYSSINQSISQSISRPVLALTGLVGLFGCIVSRRFTAVLVNAAAILVLHSQLGRCV